jgi:hypothetical protein
MQKHKLIIFDLRKINKYLFVDSANYQNGEM